MTINNLYAKYAYKNPNAPILMLLHGWDGAAAAYDGSLSDLAAIGFFVLSVGMRGRDGAGGTRDASGREIYDIYDALQYARSQYSVYASQTKAAIFGGSGGGGNALAFACKFPDAVTSVFDGWGMSDYGRNNPNGWYYNNDGQYTAAIAASVGGTPAQVPDNYYARDATAAITNYTGGKLFFYHDTTDSVVPVVHTTRITDALDAAGMVNYTNRITTGAYAHGFSMVHGAQSSIVISDMQATALVDPAWTIPASGTVTVIGYIVTKRFTIWLNQGLDAAATVVYDTAAGTYTVTPLTSNPVVAVTITQGALTASGNTNGATLFTVT